MTASWDKVKRVCPGREGADRGAGKDFLEVWFGEGRGRSVAGTAVTRGWGSVFGSWGRSGRWRWGGELLIRCGFLYY